MYYFLRNLLQTFQSTAALGGCTAYSTDSTEVGVRTRKLWNAGIKSQFKGVAPAPAAPVLPAEAKWMKMF